MIQGMFCKSLPWLAIETCGTKLSFYHNIAILWAKMSRVTWTLVLENCLSWQSNQIIENQNYAKSKYPLSFLAFDFFLANHDFQNFRKKSSTPANRREWRMNQSQKSNLVKYLSKKFSSLLLGIKIKGNRDPDLLFSFNTKA